MQLATALVILLAVAGSRSAPLHSVDREGFRLALVLACMTAPVALAGGMAHRATAGSWEWVHAETSSWWVRARSAHLAVWVLLGAVILFPLQWPQLVRANWRLDGSLLADELMVFAPLLLPMLLSWAAFLEVEAGPGRGRVSARSRRVAWVWLQARHYLVLPLVPVAVVLVTEDAAQWLAPRLLDGPQTTALHALLLALLIAAFPWLARLALGSQPLADGPLRRRLVASAQSWRLGLRDILVWSSEGRVVNAAVTGWMPGLRYIFLSDGLLRRLTDDEVSLVFTHEAGHLRHRHPVWRLMVLLVPLSAWYAAVGGDAVAPLRSGAAAAGTERAWQAAQLAPPAGLALAAIAAGVGVLLLGWFARRMEHQADLWTCRTASRGDRDEPLRAEAVEPYLRVLEKLHPPHPDRHRLLLWLHPRLEHRTQFLRGMLGDRPRETRFQLQQRLATAAIVPAILLPPIVRLLVG